VRFLLSFELPLAVRLGFERLLAQPLAVAQFPAGAAALEVGEWRVVVVALGVQ
jgi:hypothetical protein